MILGDIFKQVRHEIEEYKTGTVKLADGYQFSTYRLINKITLYLNSRFESGNRDSRGRRKFFYNIVLFRRDTTKRMLDVDVKHFRFISQNMLNQLRALFWEYAFKNWARLNNFGTLLNDAAEQVASYGTVIFKIVRGALPSIVDIRRVYFDQGAESLQKANYIIEEHLLSPHELLKKIDDGWNERAARELLARWRDSGEPFIRVFERQGVVPQSWVKRGGKEDKYVKGLFIVADIENYKKTRGGEIEGGLILYKQEIDEVGYYDFSIRKQRGRLLGVGDVELLLDAQVRRNEIANQKAVAMEISSKHIFITPDQGIVGSNFLTDYVDGTILQGSQLTPVATENRDLSSWRSEEAVWDLLADRLTFAYDVVRGESLPATTPATNALIQERQTMGNFALMRQNFALFLERLVGRFLMPKLLKQFNENEILHIVADTIDDVERVDSLLVEEFKNHYAYQHLTKTGFYPDEASLAEFEGKIKREIARGGLVRVIRHNRDYFVDFEPQIIVNVSNESIDPATELINLQNFITQIANPVVLRDPVLKKFVYKIAERMGISVADLQRAEEVKATSQAAAPPAVAASAVNQPQLAQ